MEVNIKPQVSGIIDELYVEAGDIISKGQRIARIKLIPNEVNIHNAQSNVELACIRVREAEREVARQSEVFSGKLGVKEVKRSLDIAKNEEERNRQLLDDGIISEHEYLQFKLDLDLRQNASDNTSLLSSNILEEVKSRLDISKHELEAAENNLQLLREGRTN